MAIIYSLRDSIHVHIIINLVTITVIYPVMDNGGCNAMCLIKLHVSDVMMETLENDE